MMLKKLVLVFFFFKTADLGLSLTTPLGCSKIQKIINRRQRTFGADRKTTVT